MKVPVGIQSASCRVPESKRQVQDLLQEEGAKSNSNVIARLGIKEVALKSDDPTETASNLAVAAAREALARAKVDPMQVDVVVEYSIMPQEYLVPVWNMGNKVQAEVGAQKSFVVGFSGGGSSNFMVALSATSAMLSENDAFRTALLVAGDTTIPGNRILNPEDPVTVLGDGASAIVLQRNASAALVVDTELWSEGKNHDVCYIPGGSLIHPDDIGLYMMTLSRTRYDAFPKTQILRQMSDRVLARSGLTLSDIKSVLCANISAEDESAIQEAFDGKVSPVCASNRYAHGHMMGSDFPLNYLALTENGASEAGDYLLLVSHGMGATAAITLLRH